MDMQAMHDEFTDHGFEDTSPTRKTAIVNDTVWDICSREPWPFLEKRVNLTFSGSSTTPSNMPSDFRAVLKLVNTATGTTLVPQRLDEFTSYFILRATDVADPFTYHFLGNSLELHPVPPSGTTIRMAYIMTPPALGDTAAQSEFVLPVRHHRAIVLGSLAKLYLMEDDTEMAQAFQQLYEQRLQVMRQDLWTPQFDRTDTIKVLDGDDYEY